MYNVKMDIFNKVIIEMGNRVGLDWKTFDDVLQYQKEHGERWYTTQTWSKDEENDYCDWVRKYLKKNTSWSKYSIDREVAMFMLMYGWKVDYEQS